MGNKRMIYGSVKNVCHRPTSSDFHEGCFMIMTLDPSDRITSFASTSVQARIAPRTVRTRNPTYVPSLTDDAVVVWMFWPRGICKR